MNRTSILFPLLLAVLSGCSASSPSSTGKTEDETLSNPDADAGCAPANNPEGCPAQYSADDEGDTCPTAGLECKYPGQSDNYGVCGDFALLQCAAQDGGALTWSATQ